MGEFEYIEQFLRDVAVNYQERSEDTQNHIIDILKNIKAQAVQKNDQETAKQVWCYEKIANIQHTYLSAFSKMKEEGYYDAWCLLERVEIELNSLMRHYVVDGDDIYQLKFIEKHTEQFQTLFPYKLFLSPAYLYIEKKCSICDKIVSIREPCGHKKGEIYNGEECLHVITKFEILEVSIVPNPVQKYSVLFLKDSETNEQIDHYDYSLVKYAIDGLRNPFDPWDVRWTKIRQPHSLFQHVDRNDKCPCGSGKKYRKCCLKKSGVLRPHVEFLFHVPPPENLSRMIYPEHKET